MIGAAQILRSQERIVLKPNLVKAEPHPLTTPPDCVAAVIAYCRERSDAEIVVAEGSGGGDTLEAYAVLEYTKLSKEWDVPLLDLDREKLMRFENASHRYLREFFLPRCLLDAFLISIPVLKAHSMSQVTLSLKNMLGIAPARHYAGGAFRKSKLHGRNNWELHRYIVELNAFKKPDLTVLDATIGMAEAHLWGRRCDPPVNRVLAGFDPVALDAAGAALLGFNWRDVDHIALAHGILGWAELE